MPQQLSARGGLQPHRNPWWYRLLNSGYSLADRCNWAGPIDAQRMVDRAVRAQGGRGFEHEGYRAGLDAFVDALNNETRLNGFGRLMVDQLLGGSLRRLLQLEQWAREHPAIAQEQVKQPLIIAGLPRTGTTFLFGLLSQDLRFRVPRTFEIDRPVPPPGPDAIEKDPRVREVQRGIDVIHRIVPHFQAIHPMGASYPEECQNIFVYQFSSVALQHIVEVPSYRDWLLAHNFEADLHFHRAFLQHLQSAWKRPAWLLKSPAHVQYLATLLKVYPDARIIHTHRDPAEVMASISSLSWTMQDVFSDHVTPEQAGAGQLHYWTGALECTLRDRQQLGDTASIQDLRYKDLLRDPMAALENIYRGFDLELSEQTRQRMEAYLQTHRQYRHGSHRYNAESFGLDDLDKIDVFGRYRESFGV